MVFPFSDWVRDNIFIVQRTDQIEIKKREGRDGFMVFIHAKATASSHQVSLLYNLLKVAMRLFAKLYVLL